LKQILINLIGNALKFTFKGSITVDIKYMSVEGKDMLEIKVQDTGIGLNQDEIDKLFVMFNKLERSKHMNKGGTGLGLVISNDIVKRLGDDTNQGIKVESKIDVGTTFSFTLENK
jgi:signal transduction histidine kinase